MSYYGGKSRLAHLYPAPQHDIIIEPFAGGASYSALYWQKEVRLYDADPITASIWEFLLSKHALYTAICLVPTTVEPGQKVTDLLPAGAPTGLIRFLQSEANFGTQGAKGVHNQITRLAAESWHRIFPKLHYWLPRIRHWTFTKADYTAIPNVAACWFIDPPYKNTAGSRYRTQVSDYTALGTWCHSRSGQVIVCENAGADWLPFNIDLAPRRGVISSYQKSQAMEVYWTNAEGQEGKGLSATT
jgi:hypothetical protein